MHTACGIALLWKHILPPYRPHCDCTHNASKGFIGQRRILKDRRLLSHLGMCSKGHISKEVIENVILRSHLRIQCSIQGRRHLKKEAALVRFISIEPEQKLFCLL
jgi:hypothetical protein